MSKILFAGASSFFGIADITEMLLKCDICTEYIETPDMAKYLSIDDMRFVSIKESINDAYDFIIPLNEYWVTKCKEAKISNIGKIAFDAARSKIMLSDAMRGRGLDFCFYRPIDESLVHEIDNENKEFIIKPEGLYSCHGVSVLRKENINQLNDLCKEASFVNDTTKKVLNCSESKPICVAYIKGEEYSADVFVHHGNCVIVRVCKKKIEIIKNKPFVLGYLLIDNDRYGEILRKWCNVLFGEGDISFAQFDFIVESKSSKVIPIDFSCRIGGGLKNLFITDGNNVYLHALGRAFGEKENKLKKTNYSNCQLYLFPNKSGVVKNNDYSITNGIVYINKRRNDSVTDAYPSQDNRLAEIILHINSEDEFDTIADRCVVGEEYIEDNKEAAFRFIKYALEFGRIAYNESQLLLKINEINTYQDILNISYNEELYDWKASLVYNLFDFDIYRNCSLNKQSHSTYILFFPTTMQQWPEYIKSILSSDIYTTETFDLSFSRKLIAYIYGGFPWFESCVKFIDELGIIGKKTICVRAAKKDGSDILTELIDFKNRFRKENTHCILKKEYNNEFPGIINPFHTPNPIENDVHSAKIWEEIEKWQGI
jgi:hypothetical protein